MLKNQDVRDKRNELREATTMIRMEKINAAQRCNLSNESKMRPIRAIGLWHSCLDQESKEKEAEEGEKGGSTGAHFWNRLVLFILTS